jgi:proline racemase
MKFSAGSFLMMEIKSDAEVCVCVLTVSDRDPVVGSGKMCI